MIYFERNQAEPLAQYAEEEAARLLGKLSGERISSTKDANAKTLKLIVDPSLDVQEIAIESTARRAELRGGSPAALLHAVYTFCQELGCVFEFSGERNPKLADEIRFPVLRLSHRPSVSERGIRMHLNFVQDQSYFTEDEFAGFIDNMARLRLNYLTFHMYTPLQWFPFSYRGVEHLDHSLGGARRPLPAGMIGRKKVKVKDHWFPRELESIRDPRKLLAAMHSRYQRMMAHAHERGIRNCVSFEPEALPPALCGKLAEWTGEDAKNLLANPDLNQDWQEGWSGSKLVAPDVRHPLIIDISVERVLQCIKAFPDLDEIALISREGTKWTPKGDGSFEAEWKRLAAKFGLGKKEVDRKSLDRTELPDKGPEMMPQARPYWTVLPGENFHGTVLGSLRFVEHALAVLQDARVRKAIKARGIATSIAVYSPHPETVRLMMPAISKMLPRGMRFHCLADYGARDIAANLPAWKPLIKGGQKPGVISWLEFDGIMALGQGWIDSLIDNVKQAVALGVDHMVFNHWRVRSLEHNAAAASALAWDAKQTPEEFKRSYFGRLFGAKNVALAAKAYRLLEEATLFTKTNGYNVGFAGDWVFRVSTNPPGYYWPRLLRTRQQYALAAKAFSTLAQRSTETGRRQAAYMADLCGISADHVQAIYHLQNAKLPLCGYKAWPLGNENASWPPPEQLRALAEEAGRALKLQKQYMRTYARWVETCDEQGHLCSHQVGVIEPFEKLVNLLEARLKIERSRLEWLKQPLKHCSDIQPT